MSLAEMYFQLERSAGVSPTLPQVAFPLVAPSATALPVQLPQAGDTPVVTRPPSLPAPSPLLAAPTPQERGGFGWLLPAQKPKVPPLAELLGKEQLAAGLLRAVASELNVDAPDGLFDEVPGLTRVPASVPKITRIALLHAATKAEAERFKATERAAATMDTARSMLVDVVDRAAQLQDRKQCIASLDGVIRFAANAEQLCEQLAPNVEMGKLVYEGPLRNKRLEGLYVQYLDVTVQQVQQQSALILSSMMGGDNAQTEQLQAKLDQCDQQRRALAALFKISEGKAEGMMEKRVTAAAADALKGAPGAV